MTVTWSTQSDVAESYTLLRAALDSYEKEIENSDLKRIVNSFESLSDDDREWLSKIHEKLGIENNLAQSIREAVRQNQSFLNRIQIDENDKIHADAFLSSRVRMLPWVAAREWGSEPELVPERNIVHGAILDAIVNAGISSGRVLVPGCGMGRLAFEIASLGFDTVGVEFDQLKVAAAKHIYETGLKGESIDIQPFVLETCNRRTANDHVRKTTIPDRVFDDVNVSIDGREFTEFAAATPENLFDVIVTSFFLDTTTEIACYVSGFKRLLKPGGLWINCGPLSYHYGSERSVACVPRWREMNAEEVMQTVKDSQFNVERQSEIETEYLGNAKSLMSTKQKCIFFVARKC